MTELTIRFRDGFYLGLGLAVVVGIFLVWLWRPERQVSRHTETLLHRLETRNWAGVSSLIDPSYADQWGEDRAVVLARLHEIFRVVPNAQIRPIDPVVIVDHAAGKWRARIRIEGNPGEVIALLKERINPLTTPFELEWRHLSAKPWDWKLVRVTNPELEIPEGFE